MMRTTYPISCQKNELVLICQMSVGHFWDCDDTIVFQIEVTKCTGHCKPRRVIERQPDTWNLWLILQCKETSTTLTNTVCFSCNFVSVSATENSKARR